ncbi:hypothetical protein LVY72_09590 [Arthrobacter sp. I2-34]|uniref:Uncharacterized protein n=1 Tax=Arthrobacter hankyongi TaxID=2904801 RepID=A0ABS9L667_9MICC|nr:hypothetical protein [Arthrobacter hankyongi]MCG2622170.1 hypothetical protein [Arthrobacter hankyongi]
MGGRRQHRRRGGRRAQVRVWGAIFRDHDAAAIIREFKERSANGTRIFEDRQDLKPVAATLCENSMVLLRYEIKKQVEVGTNEFVVDAASGPPKPRGAGIR